MKSYRIIFFAGAARSVAAAASTTCYYPDGVTIDKNHVPCNSTLPTSACCDPIDSCTSSGLCLGRTGFNYRGSCTDKTWTSSNCATECLSDPFNKNPYNSYTALWSCNQGGEFQADWCCDSPKRNCCTIATFDYGTTGTAFKPGMDQMLLTLAAINSSEPVTITVTASATSSFTSSTSSLISSTGSSNTSNSAETTKASTSSSSSNIGTAVGAGVGVPLGILAVGILGFLFYRERRHSQYNAQQTDSRSHIMEMDPPKGYYNPQPPISPQPQQQQPYTPYVEAQGESRIAEAAAMGPQKTPAYGNMRSNVHELI